jgi:hypothetical protein
MKKNAALIISLVILILVLVGGFLFVKSLFKPAPQTTTEEEQVTNLPPVDESVKVNLTKSSDGKSVDLTIAGIPDNTESIEYEMNYTTGAGLPKGAIGKIKSTDISGKVEVAKNILLGTCSTGGKCTYDTGVTKVNLVLKFNITDGAKQFIKEYPLE